MKKLLILAMILLLMFAVVGCDEMPASLTVGDDSDTADVDDTADAVEDKDILSDDTGEKSDSSLDYYLGDEIQTDFFAYTVVDAFSTQTFGDYTAAEGNQLVVVAMKIENTSSYSMPMSQYDFQIQWGSGDEDYGAPIDNYCEEQFANEYEIPIAGNAENNLVFEVPAGNKDFSVSFLEYYEDETEGDAFFTYFTAEEKAA